MALQSPRRTRWLRACRSLAAPLVLPWLGFFAAGEARADSLADGLSALEASDYAAAEHAFESAANGGGAKAPALVGLARTLLLTGRPGAAADTAARARSARDGDAKTRDEATEIEARALLHQGKRKEALARLEAVQSDADARRSHLLLGAEYRALGRRDDARRILLTIIEDYNDGKIDKSDVAGLTLVGRAAHLLGSARDANDAYNQAERASKGANKKNVETLLDRADLFLDKYDPGHAEEVLGEALHIAPHDPRLHAKMAHTRLVQAVDFDSAEKEATAALEVDKTQSEAYFVRAGVAVWQRDFAGADAAVDNGLAVSPGDLDLLAMRAVIRFLADDRKGFERAKSALFAISPGYQRFYEYFGDFGEWLTRYDDLLPVLREGTKNSPDEPKGWATLGLTLLRMGEEQEGLEALRRSWQKDKFNVRAFNTLNLYEKQVPESYETVEGSPFRIRYAKTEKSVLSRYVPAMLADGWQSMIARYSFTPAAPITVELYANREQFSVRMVGLPRVPFEGVCFGRVIAAQSPTAAAVNWGVTLWHELGHVFALQLSKGRVPKWFTEGLSEYETLARRPEWKREQDPLLYAALQAGRIPSIDKYNDIFTRAHAELDVLLGYYASSQLSLFLVDSFGMPKIATMLRLWADGLPDDKVFSRALGLDTREIDRRFRGWLHQRLARYDRQFVPNPFAAPLATAEEQATLHPDDARKQVELALASIEESHDAAKASKAIDKALQIDPLEPDARFLHARLAKQDGRADEAEREFLSMVREGNDGYEVRLQLAKLAASHRDKAGARTDLEIAYQFDPNGDDAIRGLYEMAERDHKDDDALDWLRKLVAVDQNDRKAYRVLLERLIAKKAWKEAASVGESAMFVDVENADVHLLYAQALSELGDHTRAAYELESALACDVEKKKASEAHLRLAREMLSLKDAKRARTERDEAVRLDPDNTAAKELKIP